MILLFLVNSFFLLISCQVQRISVPPLTTTLLPTVSHTSILTATPTITATPIPPPTVTFPAPLPFNGTLPSGVEARFGLGEFGGPALSPDGNYLAVTSGVGIILYHPETLTEIGILPQEGYIGSVAWSPDSKKLAAVSSPESVTIWDVEKARPIQKLTASEVSSLAWSPDGKKLALANGNKIVEVWDLNPAKLVRSFTKHATTLGQWGKIVEMYWINGNEIVSLDENSQLVQWETDMGRIIHAWRRREEDASRRIALSPDKETLAIASLQSQKILLWNLASQKEQKTINLPRFIMEMAWSPDGKSIALVTQFPSKLVFVDVNSGTVQKEFSTNAYSVSGVSWLQNGKEVITISGPGDGEVITVWDIQTGEGICGIRSLGANRVAWTPDGKTIAASRGGAVVLWDVQTGNPRVLPGEIRNGLLDGGPNYEGIFRIAFNPSGNLLAAESGDDSSRIRVWNTTTGELVEETWIGPHLDKLSWLSDTRLITITRTMRNEISIWELGGWESRTTIDADSFDADHLDISADGKLVALVRENVIEIRNLESGETLHSWEVGWEPKFGLAWSPDAAKIVLTDAEGFAIYEVSTGRKLNTLKRDQSGFSGLKWSPDSAAIAFLTWTQDVPPASWSATRGTGRLFLWQIAAANAKLISAQKNLYLLADNLCFSPDGKRLALALGQKGLVILRLWW